MVTTRMLRLQLPIVVKLVVGISICFIFLQTLLLVMCNCRCSSNVEEDTLSFKKRSADNLDALVVMKDYQRKVLKLQDKIKRLEDESLKHQRVQKFIISEELQHRKRSLDEETFLNSYVPKNEFEVIPYNSFTSKHLFGDIGYLSKRPSSSPIGQQITETREVLDIALKSLNADVESKVERTQVASFAEGIMRNDLIHGTVYDLYFRSTHSQNIFKRLKLLRPFGNVELIGKVETIDTSNEWINIILPLSERLEAFKTFMDRFVDTCIRTDRRIFLTIVYFGQEGRSDIRQVMLDIEQKESFTDYKVIFSDEEFNRGRGIQQGVENWDKGNVLMFFCDVDIYFNVEFLERCRLHTSPQQRIYYPIVFSQYNPEIVFGGNSPPSLKDQVYLNYDSGFWRDFGFGMTCQYKDDFLNAGGFDLSIRGWGGEDVALYKQHLRSKLTLIRSYDRGILHIYHQKNCHKTSSDQQFISCLQSKAVTEGSHKQLGMLAFGGALINGDDPEWGKRLRSSLNELKESENNT